MVDLGSAASYAAISGASIGNTVSAVGAPHTTLRGDVGVAVATQPTGFPPGVITGAKNVGNAAAVQAHADLVAAYAAILARTGGVPLDGALAGATITPGLYTIGGAASNTGTLTIDAGGDPSAVFVFQINGALAFAAASHVTLTGGAQAARIFWQVNGAGAIGAGSSFAGTMIAMDAVAIGNGSLFNGRAFARNGALTMDADEFYSAPPNVTITGGATAYTRTMSPTISGTTDMVAPALVSVTINGATLTATPSAGAWTVTPATMANGTYPVTATVTDGAGNVGRAEQSLTVDTVLPVITIDGGATLATNDSTPTISGVSDVPAGTPVTVTVDAQTLTALVHAGGVWNVTPVALLDGTRTVGLSVRDAAGNEGVDTQQLTVDTTAPAVTITGGATALGNDPTPLIAGTAAVPVGTTVTVDLADETLAAIVDSTGAWSATAAHLADGAHRIVIGTADAAGNTAGATQWLTIDTIAPAMTITGGAAATTTALTPTITGTSNAAPNTTVTVTIDTQSMTTLVQGNGTWNATPTLVGLGTWPVTASARGSCRKRRDRQPDTDDRNIVRAHAPVRRHRRRRGVRNERPHSDDRRHHRRAGWNARRCRDPRRTGRANPHRTRARRRDVERDRARGGAALRGHVHRGRRGHRYRRQRRQRHAAVDDRHDRSGGHDHRRPGGAEQRSDAVDCRHRRRSRRHHRHRSTSRTRR